MKALKLIVAFCIMCGFAVSTANAQAVVVKDQQWGWAGYLSIDSHRVMTPEGDINIWVLWQLDLLDSLVPLKGVIQYEVYAVLYYEGVEYWIPGIITVTANGKAKGNWHWPPEM